MRTMQTLLIAAAAGGLLSASASAAVIAEHVGSTDPYTEVVSSDNISSTKWTRTGTSAYASALPADSVAGTPAAWEINDSGSGTLYYYYVPSAQEHSDANTDGWKLSFDLRVNSALSPIGPSIYNEYSDGSHAYVIYFGIDANGNPMVQINSGATLTVMDGDSDDTNNVKFHLYELVYDPVKGSADLFVDGAPTTVSNVAAKSSSNDRVAWGAGWSAGQASVDYSLVRFETLPVPEPTMMGVLSLGGLLLLRRRRAA